MTDDDDRKLRLAIERILEFMPGFACTWILGLTFAFPGGGIAVWMVQNEWSWGWWLPPLFGIVFAAGFYGFSVFLRRIHNVEVSGTTRRREKHTWITAPLGGLLLGFAAALFISLFG